MSSPLQQLKRKLKKVVGKGGEGVFFGIDEQPDLTDWIEPRVNSWEFAETFGDSAVTSEETAEHEEGEGVDQFKENAPKNIVSGWCFSIDGLITIQVEINGTVVFESRPWLARPDVHGMHKSVGQSLCSGFSFSFPPEVLAKIGSGKVVVKAIAAGREHALWTWSEGVAGTDEPEAIAELSSWFKRLATSYKSLLPANAHDSKNIALVVPVAVLESSADFSSHLRELVAKASHYSLYTLGAESSDLTGERIYHVHSNEDIAVALQAKSIDLVCFIGTTCLRLDQVIPQLCSCQKKHDLNFLQPVFLGGQGALPAPFARTLAELEKNFDHLETEFLSTTNSVGPIWIATRGFVNSTSLGNFSKKNSFETPVHSLVSTLVELPDDKAAPYSFVERHTMAAVFNIHCTRIHLSKNKTVYVLADAYLLESQNFGAGLQLLRACDQLEKSGHTVVVISNLEERDGGYGFKRVRFGKYFVLNFSQITSGVQVLASGMVLCGAVSMLSEAFTLAYISDSRVAWYVLEGEHFQEFEKATCFDRAYKSRLVPVFPAAIDRVPARFEEHRKRHSRYGLPFLHGRKAKASESEVKIVIAIDGMALDGKVQAALSRLTMRDDVTCVQVGDRKLQNCATRVNYGELLEKLRLCDVIVDLTNPGYFSLLPFEAAAQGKLAVVLENSYAAQFVQATGSQVVSPTGLLSVVDELEGDEQQPKSFKGDPSAMSLDSVFQAYDAISTLELARFEQRVPVSVVVPVYNSLDSVVSCVESFLAIDDKSVQLYLVNDCSDSGTTAWISEVAAQYENRITAIHKETNEGFIEACRTGLDAVPDNHDVVLLNSDVLLTESALRNLRDAAYSRPWVGLASPLSTGSPNLQIDVPAGSDLYETARALAADYTPTYPTVITPEGQCLYMRRWAIDTFGFFDPVYERGFCEESDLSMRMLTCGVDMVCADNALIGHERSASFGKSTRNKHLLRNRPVFDGRWGTYYKAAVTEFVRRNPIQPVRDFVKSTYVSVQGPSENFGLEGYLETMEEHASEVFGTIGALEVLGDAEVIFVLPSVMTGGGSLSVLQHANEMIRRGVKARVISLTMPGDVQFSFRAPVIPVSIEEFFQLDWNNQHVVATFWLTTYLVSELETRCPTIKGYYYVQDYEPWFYSRPDMFKVVKAAEKTFDLGLTCVAKTKFLQEVVKEKHAVDVLKVTPGVQRSIFYPGDQDRHTGRPRLAGLFRARTQRRGGRELSTLLEELFKHVPELDVSLFGDEEGVPESLSDRVSLVGALSQRQVADLYRRSDMVIDLSYWHGFGRMGIEGMACGAVPILSDSGGVREYATDNENAVFVDINDLHASVHRIVRLIKDREYRMRLRAQGFTDLAKIGEDRATSDWLQIFGIETKASCINLPCPVNGKSPKSDNVVSIAVSG